MKKYLYLFLFLISGCVSTMSYKEQVSYEKREEAILKEKAFDRWDVTGKIEKGLIDQCERW